MSTMTYASQFTQVYRRMGVNGTRVGSEFHISAVNAYSPYTLPKSLTDAKRQSLNSSLKPYTFFITLEFTAAKVIISEEN